MITVLHITAHMGGGVGRVIRNLIDGSCEEDRYAHQVNCLETANALSREWAETSGIRLQDDMAAKYKTLHHNMAQADIVHLHWWNHPLTYHLIADPDLPEIRTVTWSHVNGHQAPHVFTRQVVMWPDRFVVATPHSLQAPLIQSMPVGLRNKKIRVIQSCAGIAHVSSSDDQPHAHFNVGYVGTVDYCKLHPRFAEMCLKADIPDVRFILCGEDNGGQVARHIASGPGAEKFEFRGWVDDISHELALFDVLGYPLDEHHYGTGEQVLIEAMAAGVPPVVLDNGAERYIVKEGETGLVAADTDAYIHALEFLHQNPVKRREMARQARRYARKHFGIRCTVNAWHQIYDAMLKRERRQPGVEETRPLERGQDEAVSLFLESLGACEAADVYTDILSSSKNHPLKGVRERLQRLKPIFCSQTRGSAFHYRTHFPESDGLNHLCGVIQDNMQPELGAIDAG